MATRFTAIDVVETAYDLEVGPEDWLARLLDAAGKTVDRGLGCAAAVWAGTNERGEPLVSRMVVRGGEADLAVRFASAAQRVGIRLQHQTAKARRGGVRLLSEARASNPEVYEAITHEVRCRDVLGIWALDPDLQGVAINVPAAETLEIRFRQREFWTRLSAHIRAAHRLRRNLGRDQEVGGIPATKLPLNAEALLDPKGFTVTDARGMATRPAAIESLRRAAVNRDRARSRSQTQDPARALEGWQGLVSGRWSLIDWFDSDGRRYILAKPNAPRSKDPRGLTEREQQVVTSLSLGDTNKITAYRLGVSPSRVSDLLLRAKRKLGARSTAELILKVRALDALKSAH